MSQLKEKTMAQALIAACPVVGKHVFHSDKMLEMRVSKILQLVLINNIFKGDLVDQRDLVGDPYPKTYGCVQIPSSQQIAGTFFFHKGITTPYPNKRIGPAVAPGLYQIAETVIQRTVKGNIIQVVHLHIAIFADLVIGN